MGDHGVWITEGFEAFRRGTFGNAGHNLYVSRAGVLQRIHQHDVNRDGYVDLVFCNDHSHSETPPTYVYRDPLGQAAQAELSTEGAKAGAVADLNGDGFDDIILGMWHNGMRHDLNAYIYYGGPDGWSERRTQRLPVPLCTSVAAGDFDGDGRIDLAFLGRVDMDWQKQGQLRLFIQSELGYEPKRFRDLPDIEGDQIAAEDLDGDGYADLILRRKNGQVRVYWGGADGISPQRMSLVPGGPVAGGLEELELNKPADEWIGEPTPLACVLRLKGIPYIFVAREDSALLVPVAVDRTFGPPLIFGAAHPVAVAAGDVNGNGYDDIVVACTQPCADGECSFVYWGSALGYDDERRTALGTRRVMDAAVGDLDGDGFDDIVFCQSHSETSYTLDSFVYRGGPGGVQAEPTRLTAENPQRVLLAHLAREPHPSLVFVNFRGGNLRGDICSSVFFGGPDGYAPFRRKDLPTWRAVDSICCDFNDDGYADIAFVNSYDQEPDEIGQFIYLSGPVGFPDQPSQRLPLAAGHGVVCADLNRDGYLDLLFSSTFSPDLAIFYGTANGFDAEHPQTIRMEKDGQVYSQPRFLYLADLNNDDWLDLVVPQIADDRSLILWGGPEGFSMRRCQELSVWHSCSARSADLTGNGYLDLIIGGHEPSREGPHDSFVYVYWNGPGGLREDRRTVLPANAVNSMAIADFNNDGCLDLFITSYHNGRERDIDSYIYWNRRGRGFAAADRQRLFTHSASGCLAADFNEDGWIDLAVGNHKTDSEHVGDSWVWWNGPAGFQEGRVTCLPTWGPHGMTSVEPGNIRDRGPEEYYISAPFKLPPGATVRHIGWRAELAPKTWVRAQVRFADTEETLAGAAWLGPTGAGSWYDNDQPVDANAQPGRWVQYRLALGATNSCGTPRVSRVVVRL